MQQLGLLPATPTSTTDAEDGRAVLTDLAALLLETVTDRVDAAINAASYTQAASCCTDVPSTVPGISNQIPTALVPNARRSARTLLTTGQFQEDSLRMALATAMHPAEVQVVRLEYADAEFSDSTWTILSVHEVAPGRAAPLDWCRIRRGAEDDDQQLRVAMAGLLDRLVRRQRPHGAQPPVVSLDRRLGECPLVRAIVAERVPEHGFVVDRRYARERLVEDVYRQRRAAGGVGDSFGEWQAGESPRPLPVKHAGRPFDEFAVPFGDGDEPGFAFVRPSVPSTSMLTGRRRENRAAAIAETVRHLRPETMTARLGIDTFRTLNDVTWDRHALLVSAHHDVSTGLLAPSESARARVVAAMAGSS